MKTKHLISALVVCFFIFAAQVVDAKKHKDAPDKTVVIMVGAPNETFDEGQFSHLEFYYLPDIIIEQEDDELVYSGAPDFIARWGSREPLVKGLAGNFVDEAANNAVDNFLGNKREDKKMYTALLVDKNGVVAFQQAYPERITNDGGWTILSMKSNRKDPLEDHLKKFVRKEKDAREDRKKSYVEGEEPNYRSWKKGDIEGMALPDFKLTTSDGTEKSMHEILKGKPTLVLFNQLDPEKDYQEGENEAENLKDGEGEKKSGKGFLSSMAKAARGESTSQHPMLWHLENVMYDYYKPRE